ncbi:hypothetical protein GTGU_01765 [Trabulsiella guamensis ATCC 49490]|uniref:Uncharacterized protein n=1 Tax=Trabulsiella guamensis ATCC 49490 TaxID=1005994 RepID=A0A085ABJ5_9ENTR|nr:hypothetical protein GTGU_01765 [Trabulsiella guamensis ATCC 49490]
MKGVANDVGKVINGHSESASIHSEEWNRRGIMLPLGKFLLIH